MKRAAAYVGLGSNMGDRSVLLLDAVRRLAGCEETRVTDVSPLYETDPVGVVDQPLFLNMVCRLETALAPEALLQKTLAIELELGRERTQRWGPRTIDIDILLYDNRTIHSPDLTVPHPRLMERAFVLVPLRDVLRDSERNWRPGFTDRDVDATGVRRWNDSNNWQEEFARSES